MKIITKARGLVKAYPVIAAGAANIIIALAARYGVHVTGDQLATVVSVATAALAALTHRHVSPVAKPKSVSPAPK